MKISHLKLLIENGNIHISAVLDVNFTITFFNCGFILNVIDIGDNILCIFIVNRKYFIFIITLIFIGINF